MARSVKSKGRNNSEESVNGPQMSQQSNSSTDDSALALVKNFQAKSERKEKEEQNRLIQGVSAQFAKTKREMATRVRAKLQSLAELHAAFCTEAAEIDDQIRSTWVLMGEEHVGLLKFAGGHKEYTGKLESERMKRHIDNLAKQKHAYESYEGVYNDLAKPFPTER